MSGGTRTISPQTSVNLRPLGAYEHLAWLLDEYNPVHFSLVAEVEGRTTIEDWRDALHAVQQSQPLFSVCIALDQNSIPHFRRKPESSIPLRVIQGDSSLNWESEVTRELSTPFYGHSAPLVRAVLLHGARKSIIILTVHHAIADARALAAALRDTVRAVSGRPLGRLPLPPSQDELLGLHHNTPVGGASGIYIAQTRANEPTEEVPTAHHEKNRRVAQISSLNLAPELTQRIRERAREEKTTVHGALCAGLVSAGRQISTQWEQKTLRVSSPIDIRNLLNIDAECGMLLGYAVSTIESGRSGSFWDLARLITDQLVSERSLENVSAGLQGLIQMLSSASDVKTATEMALQEIGADMMVSNLGELPFESSYGDFAMKAMWGPAVLSSGHVSQTIGVITLDDSLQMVHTSRNPLPSLLHVSEQFLIRATGANA